MIRQISGSRVILVAVDTTTASYTACKWAVDNLVRPGDYVHLLHVIQPSVGLATHSVGFVPVEFFYTPDSQHDDALRFIERSFSPLLRNIPHQVDVKKIDTTDFKTTVRAVGNIICRHAESIQAAAIVMSSHDKGKGMRMFLGSTTELCVQTSKRPVVIVR